ncbi:MAG: hypothetical protein JXR10_06220 [Cyclobacteriaceae bacterium]
MELRIKELLEKYWSGESTLDEEAEIKSYFAKNPSLSGEGRYFRQLAKVKGNKQVKFKHPGKKIKNASWSVAATVTIGLVAAVMIFQDAKKQQEQFVVEDPKEAYEITRKALLMVSSGLQEGRNYSQEINKINKAEEILIEN